MFELSQFLRLAASFGAEKIEVESRILETVLKVQPSENWPLEVELQDIGGSQPARELRQLFEDWKGQGARAVHYRRSSSALNVQIRAPFRWGWWKRQLDFRDFALAPFELSYHAIPVRKTFPLPGRYDEVLWVASPGEVGLRIRHRQSFRGTKERYGYRFSVEHGGYSSRDNWRFYVDGQGREVTPESLFQCRCRAFFLVHHTPGISLIHLFERGGFVGTARLSLPKRLEVFFSLEGAEVELHKEAMAWDLWLTELYSR